MSFPKARGHLIFVGWPSLFPFDARFLSEFTFSLEVFRSSISPRLNVILFTFILGTCIQESITVPERRFAPFKILFFFFPFWERVLDAQRFPPPPGVSSYLVRTGTNPSGGFFGVATLSNEPHGSAPSRITSPHKPGFFESSCHPLYFSLRPTPDPRTALSMFP